MSQLFSGSSSHFFAFCNNFLSLCSVATRDFVESFLTFLSVCVAWVLGIFESILCCVATRDLYIAVSFFMFVYLRRRMGFMDFRDWLLRFHFRFRSIRNGFSCQARSSRSCRSWRCRCCRGTTVTKFRHLPEKNRFHTN